MRLAVNMVSHEDMPDHLSTECPTGSGKYRVFSRSWNVLHHHANCPRCVRNPAPGDGDYSFEKTQFICVGAPAPLAPPARIDSLKEEKLAQSEQARRGASRVAGERLSLLSGAILLAPPARIDWIKEENKRLTAKLALSERTRRDDVRKISVLSDNMQQMTRQKDQYLRQCQNMSTEMDSMRTMMHGENKRAAELEGVLESIGEPYAGLAREALKKQRLENTILIDDD